MTPITNVAQLVGPVAVGANVTTAIASAFAAASQLVHLPAGPYRIASQITFPAGTLTVNGAACWQPASATGVCLDAQRDLALRGDNMCECAAALAAMGGPGASAWLHIGAGNYRLASPVGFQQGTLMVAGSLDWTPASAGSAQP